MINTIRKTLLLASMAAVVPIGANAACMLVETQSQIFGPTTVPFGPVAVSFSPYTGSYPLCKVEALIDGTVSVSVDISNTSPLPQIITPFVGAQLTATGPLPLDTGFQAFLGVPVNIPILPAIVNVSASKNVSDMATENSDFSAFTGPGNVDFNVSAFGSWTMFGITTAILDVKQFDGQGTVTLKYYADVPEPQHYAMLAGLGLIGLAGWRRFRQ